MSNLELKKQGRRYYVEGPTYPLRDALRNRGFHWDPEQRAWWTGKESTAESFVREFSGRQESSARSESHLDDRVVAKVEYKGRTYYAKWIGMTKRGTEAARLVFRDGSKEFWADLSECRILKRYGREYRGRMEYPTVRSLQEFAKKAREARERGESVDEMKDREAMERAERRGVCRAPGCCAAPAPGQGGYCDQCAFDEFDC